MKRDYGMLPEGGSATVYTLKNGALKAEVMDYGATLVSLWVPGKDGIADVVLGYDKAWDYAVNNSNLGATVGRNANRVGGASFLLNGQKVQLAANDNGVNNLHSGPNIYNHRMWQVEQVTESSITFYQLSPDGDQGYPGNAHIRVTYTVTENSIRISYEAVSDRDTVFNMTNHSYFNLAGHDKPEKAMEQVLQLNALRFTPADALSIPTGELREVAGTPMDFRTAKVVGRDIGEDYDALVLQKGYDHNFEVAGNPCAILQDVSSGRTMEVYTDRPGLQFYSGNYLDKVGKGGTHYPWRGAVCLETQFFPDAVNKPQWQQPFVKAGQVSRSVTEYKFKW